MIFQHSPPLFIKSISSKKIVILTKYRIIYSMVDKIVNSFHAILVESNPLFLEYSNQRQESLVVTRGSIEVYSCDFLNEICLKKLVILNQQRVWSVVKNGIKDWEIFGQIYQYSTQNLKIFSVESKATEEQVIQNCFIDQFEIYITKNKLIAVFDHRKVIGQQIKWNEQTRIIEKYLKDYDMKQIKLKGWKMYLEKLNAKGLNLNENCFKSEMLPQSPRSVLQVKNQYPHHQSVFQQSQCSNVLKSSLQIKQFVLIVQIDQRFLVVLTPPERQYLEGIDGNSFGILSSRKGSFQQVGLKSTDTKLSSNVRGQANSNSINIINKSSLDLRNAYSRTTKWGLKHLDFNNNLSVVNDSVNRNQHTTSVKQTPQQILFSSLYRNPLGIQKQSQGDHMLFKQTDKLESLCVISLNPDKITASQNQSIIISLIKLQHGQLIDRNQLNLVLDQNHSKYLNIQNYSIQYSQSNCIDSTSTSINEFISFLLSSQTHSTESKNPQQLLVQLTQIQQSIDNQQVYLSFLYYAQGNQNKTLSSVKIKANKFNRIKQNHSKLNKSKSLTPTKQPIFPQTFQSRTFSNLESSQATLYEFNRKKLTIAPPPKLLQNSPLISSLSISQSSPQSQPFTTLLAFSNDISQNAVSQKLSKIQSVVSSNSNTNDPLKSLRKNSEPKTSNDESRSIQNSSKTQMNPLRLSRNRIQARNIEEKEQTQNISQFNNLQGTKDIKINYLTTYQSAIPELSQEHYNEETTKFDVEQVEGMVDIIDQRSAILSKKQVIFNPKRMDQQSQNQRQEKQFYQKFISHYEQEKQISPDSNLYQTESVEMNDSIESYEKNFTISKISMDDYTKKDKITTSIGGKDFSEIVNQKNSIIQTDEQGSVSIVTVELGNEIQQELTKNQQLLRNQQGKSSGLFFKQNQSVVLSEATVILCDKLGESQISIEEKFNQQTDQNYRIKCNNEIYPDSSGFSQDFHPQDHGKHFKPQEIGVVFKYEGGTFAQQWKINQSKNLNENEELQNDEVSIFQRESQVIKQSRRKIIDRFEFEQLSSKVKAFCLDPENLTMEEARQIESKKYTQLMREIFIRSQQKFNILMREFLPQIIREQEARLFFAEYIRTFSGKTRDIVVRLYMSLPDREQSKQLMSCALSEFKLSQVPEICLPLSKDILQVFKFLYPSVYIEDLLKPSIPLYQKLLENYFNVQKLPVDQLTIQDEVIDLSHPRNMLNVLLYLNQSYNLPMTQLFEVYCTELIKNNCSQIVVKMLREEETFEICEVSKSILEEIVETVVIQKLKESSTHIQWIGKALQILDCNISSNSGKIKNELSKILNVIDLLNMSDCCYSMDALFKLSQNKNLFVFCNTLIRQNDVLNLKKVNFQQLYKELHQIVHRDKLKFYNQELKDLFQIVCEKYFQNGMIWKGFEMIAPVIMISNGGFMAKMLFKYMDGKMMNRLANRSFDTKQEFISTFKECFQHLNQSKKNRHSREGAHIPHDRLQFDSKNSYLVNCSYNKFQQIYNNCIKSTQCQEVVFICYMDYLLASKLATYHVITKKEWHDFSDAIKDYVPRQHIKKLVAKSRLHFNSYVLIDDKENDAKTQTYCNSMLKDISLLNTEHNPQIQINLIKSLQAIHPNQQKKRQTNGKKLNVYRSKSDAKAYDENYNDPSNDPLLQSLKYEVNPQAIKSILKQLYERQNEYYKVRTFMKALSMIDRERITIYHYERFKLVANLELDFQMQKLIPFEFLFVQNYEQSFGLIKEYELRKKLQMHNFWTVYIIVQILLSKGEDVAVMMIQKLLEGRKGDYVEGIIEKILEGTMISQESLKMLATKAQVERQTGIGKRIKQRILQRSN